MSPPLLISIHDVAPSTLPESRHWLSLLEERALPATLLAVPGPWGSPTLAEHGDTAAWLRAAVARGHEVALHGWDHGTCAATTGTQRVVGRVAARGADEFLGLSRAAAEARLAAGRKVLRDAGLDPMGFTPPGYLCSRATLQAAGELGLRYLATQRGILDLRFARRHAVPALSNRAGGHGERAGKALLRQAAPRLARHCGVRIALHPADLHRWGTRTAVLEAIEGAVAGGARPMTYARYLEEGRR